VECILETDRSMKTKITRLKEIGFCYGVKRAIDIMEKSAFENGSVDCLGELVHNSEVMSKMKSIGVNVIASPAEVTAPAVGISAHGVSPSMEAELGSQPAKLIDATCPTVKRLQKAVQRLAKNGFAVIVFGDAGHTEVKGLLGWAQGRGIATLDAESVYMDLPWPRKIALISQTTQAPENYLQFVNAVLDKALNSGREISILDTVCSEVRRRQSVSRSLAVKSDLVLVVGGKNSANSRRLLELCAGSTETHLIENASEIDPEWLAGKFNIGVTSGTSTSQESVDEVMAELEKLTC
jgi:4-hydroxy-3-methylbut-2-enyl diphosphate reductase